MTIPRNLDQLTDYISRKSDNVTPAQSSLKSNVAHWGKKYNKGGAFDGNHIQAEIVAKLKQP
jgi:hypothetical protein